MSNKMSADADAYDKEYDAFVKQLEDFHQQRGTPFKRLPRINGKGIDLYLLYVVVTARGGWQKVNSRTEWEEILEDFRLPPSCINASTALKHIYIRYLDAYERIHFLGEDGDEMANNADEDESRPSRVRRNVRTLNIVPLSYNYSQHNVSEIIRTNTGMSTEMYKNSSYDRLSLSLSCPLPNEHDFAFNMCTLLSNEGKHTLQLSQCPRLVEFMLAHTGVFRDRETQNYFISNYKEAKGKSLVQFWIDSVEDKSVLDLLTPECYDTAVDNSLEKAINHEKTLKSNLLYIKPLSMLESSDSRPAEHVESSQYADSRNEDQRGGDGSNCQTSPILSSLVKKRDTLSTKLELIFKALACEGADLRLEPDDTEIFHLGRDLGLLDSEGTRISQVLHILRNLSFEEINVPSLAQSTTCLRFLVLCVCSRWGGLAVGALDTLGNIAAEIMLRDPAVDPASALLLTTICQGVSSQDRAFVLRSLEVLNKLSINDPNEEILSYNIEQAVYDQICRYLTIHDIMLLIYTLESLYSLSSLGMSACNAIVRAKGSVQTLISLLTVEAQSYGPEACIGMKVVETVTGVVSESENATSTVATITSATVTATTPASLTSGVASAQSTNTSAPLGAASVAVSSPLISVVQSPIKVVPKPSPDPKRVIPRIVPPEVEEFVIDWVMRNYEACSHNAIEQAIVYRHFAASMHSLGRKQGLNPVLLSNCVRKVFGTGVGPSRKPVEDGSEKWHYNGIKRRDGIVVPAVPDKKVASHSNSCTPQFTPTPIIPAASVSMLVSSSTIPAMASPKLEKPPSQGIQGSILKAHLSAPLRNSPSPVRISHQGVMGGSLPPSAHTTPYSNTPSNLGIPTTQHLPIPRSDNSALIKSLLATKVTTSGTGSSFPSYPSEHSSIPKQQHQHHHPHHQQPQQKNLASHAQLKVEGVSSTQSKVVVGSSSSSGPLPPISNIASFSKGPLGRQMGSLIGNPSFPFGGKVAGSVLSMGGQQGQQLALPMPHRAAVQVCRNIQKQNGPADTLQENSTDAQSAKTIINGIKEESYPERIVTTFEGILQNGIKEELKESINTKEERVETQVEKRNLLADLLERTVGGDVLNGVVDKDIRITEKGIQLVGYPAINKINGPISSPNGQLETSHGVKRPATPDTSGSVKRLAIEDLRSGSDSRITLYVSQNGNDGEVLSQGHQVILNQGQQLQHIVPTQTQMINTQTVVTPQGSMIIQRPVTQGNVIVQQTPHIISQGSSSSFIAQRNPHTSQNIFTTASSSPILTQAATGQTQVISSGHQVLTHSGGQVFHQVIAHGQGGQKVILHGGQIGQVLSGQVLLPQSGGQSIVVQGGSNISGQVIMQGVTTGSQNPVLVQGATGHGQVLVHSSGTQGQVLLQSTNAQGQLVVSGGGSGQGQSIVTNSSGQTMIVAGSQGQQVMVGGSPAQQVVMNPTNQSQGQLVVQANPVGNTVFLTPQQASQASQKTLIILPSPKVMVAGNQPSGQIVLPRQVVQQITSSSSTPAIMPSPIRTVRSVSNIGEINASAYSNNPPSLNTTGVAAAPSGPTATPVTQPVISAATHIPAPQILASGVARRPAKTGLQYICEWRGCNLVFSSPNLVYHHACKVHCPSHITELTCHWSGCDTMVRKRFSAMTHIHDKHCNEQLMQILAMRRQQVSVSGKTDIPTPQTPPPHPGYAPNAAFHAIKRHALEVIAQRDIVEKEGPVTKSIRLTAALILRNLVIYSNMGKKLLKGYESDLANVAISSMESSRTVSQILYDIHLPDHQAL